MVKQEVLSSRLAKLQEYLGYLRSLRRHPYPRFSGDPFIRGSAERYLHLAIECCLDLGHHLIADQGLRRPEDYRETFLILGEAKIIPMLFAKKIAPMGSLRNLLVHDYLRVDPKKIHQILRTHLQDLAQFARCMAKFLK